MKKQFRISLIIALLAFVALSSAAIMAQETTETPVPPPSFTDGRINSSTLLGGLAIYCVNSSGTPVSTYENGRITVWGVGDQKYIELSADQLNGDMEIPQLPSQMEAAMTPTATMDAMQATESVDMMMTEEPMPAVTSEAEVMGEHPMLLARALTPTGEIGFFSLGNEQFALQGHDENGNLFTYTWTGCTEGMIDRSTEAYLPFLAVTPMPVMTEEMTPDMMAEMTPEPTAGM